MIVLPLPMFVALVLGFLFVQGVLARNRPALFSALLLVCALQNLIVALAQYYQLAPAWKLQPVSASLIPPLAWLAFVSASIRPVTLARDWIHGFGTVFIAFCAFFAPITLDIALIALFFGYGSAILANLHLHRDALPLVRLDTGTIPQKIWTAMAVSLLFSALTDALIASAVLGGNLSWAPKIISAGSVASLFAIGVLSLSPDLRAIDPTPLSASAEGTPLNEPLTSKADFELVDRLNELLQSRNLYLDPGLTLSRLALRLGVPAKKLSAAINKTSGENVSRYINAYRIRHACSLIENGANVTTAMLESGFNTKSNFNREFARITGKTPSNWSKSPFPTESQQSAQLSKPDDRHDTSCGRQPMDRAG
ncbi:helix-turn-helix domain-containing protein [Roseibium sp. SCP14]|uniref:helix-turn-helix domain-containing protein n=1 Tax=Roseibium sp. SCP14 TaxID=3141375 RepID=UPI00333DB628